VEEKRVQQTWLMLNRASAFPLCSTASCASGFVGARLPANQRHPDRARDGSSRSRCHCAWSSLHFPTPPSPAMLPKHSGFW
jgi:hypothetical protein